MKLRFRKKGLPKRLRRIPGGVSGLVSACDITLVGGYPMAKVAVFRNRASMRSFYNNIFPDYGGPPKGSDRLQRGCMGVVSKMWVYVEKNGCELAEVDRNYFCLVLLVEGHLTAEVLCHEAVHVGFAWDMRTDGKGPLAHEGMSEENVCYPAGMFLDRVLTFIKEEKLREV